MRLKVEKMVYGGYGIARTDDGIAFVKGAISGEEVEAGLLEKKGSYFFARVVEILSPSPYRVPARCQFFGLCGGCDWQHISYDGQIAFKEEILRDLFLRIAHIDVFPEIVARSQPWRYRYRARFHTDHRGRLGFYKARTHEVVWIGECPLLEPRINEIKIIVDEIGVAEGGTEVTIRSGYKSEDVLVIFKKLKKGKRKELKRFPFFVLEDGKVIKGRPYTLERWCEREFRFSYNSFSQINPLVAEDLYLFLLKELKEFRKIWYLYSGVGIMGVLLAIEGKEVKLIESNESSVEDARENLNRNGVLGLAEVIRGEVETVFPALLEEFEGEAVLADPPRRGIGKSVFDALKKRSVEKILYVSCHPPVLARDTVRLREIGYELESLKWVDMFPQTSHIEAIGIFKKRRGRL